MITTFLPIPLTLSRKISAAPWINGHQAITPSLLKQKCCLKLQKHINSPTHNSEFFLATSATLERNHLVLRKIVNLKRSSNLESVAKSLAVSVDVNAVIVATVILAEREGSVRNDGVVFDDVRRVKRLLHGRQDVAAEPDWPGRKVFVEMSRRRFVTRPTVASCQLIFLSGQIPSQRRVFKVN